MSILIADLAEMTLFLNLKLFLQSQITQRMLIIAAEITSLTCKLHEKLHIEKTESREEASTVMLTVELSHCHRKPAKGQEKNKCSDVSSLL